MNNRNQFIRFFFEHLHQQDYVLLKHTGVIETHSDLDLLIDPQSTASLVTTICQQPGIENYQLQKQTTMWQLFLYFKDDTFLQIDFLFGFFRKDLEYLDQAEVRQQSLVDEAGYRVCNIYHLTEHVFLFHLLNHAAVPQKYLHYFSTLSADEQIMANTFLAQKYQLPGFSFLATNHYDPATRNQVVKTLHRQPGNGFFQRKTRLLRHYSGKLFQLWPQRGLTITFSGVDGAGKSTIIAEVAETLKTKYRRKVVVLRHRPSLLPILSAYRYGKENAEARAATGLPRQGNNRSSLSSFARFGYYYFDYLVGQIYVFFRYHLRSYIVLYDRYYFDFIVDGQRSNIMIGDKVPRLLYRFIYKPQLNLFLYAHPELIRRRKQELSSETIQELTSKYQNLFDSLSDQDTAHHSVYLAIENNDKETTLQTIFSNYKELVV